MGRDSKANKKKMTPIVALATNATAARKRKSAQSKRQDDNLATEQVKARAFRSTKVISTLANKSKDETDAAESRTVHGNIKGAQALDRDRPMSPLQKQRFEEWTRYAVTKGVKGILEEYAKYLKPYVPASITKKAFEANSKKNRYGDVICVDGTRVILKNQSNDYIHANFVRGDPLINTFICTQGPMMDTVKDFWKMVAQEHVGNIIMLCDTVELGKEKCQQYWPREEGCVVEWPGIQVKNVKMDITDSTTIVSTLELLFDKDKKVTLKHHHWRNWPDKGVPLSFLAAFRVLRNVRHSPRPTIVHCSAGIGRTGSVVALELCYQQLLSENKLSILECVKVLRHMRMHSVQTELQYLYLFKCLLTFSQKYKTIPADCMTLFENFYKEYQALTDSETAKEKPDFYAPLLPYKVD